MSAKQQQNNVTNEKEQKQKDKRDFRLILGSALTTSVLISAVQIFNQHAADQNVEEREVCASAIVLPQTEEQAKQFSEMSEEEMVTLQQKAQTVYAEKSREFALRQNIEDYLAEGKQVTITALNKDTNCYDIKLKPLKP